MQCAAGHAGLARSRLCVDGQDLAATRNLKDCLILAPDTARKAMQFNATQQAAQTLCEHRLGRTRFQGLPETCRPADERAAYAVQATLHTLLGRSRLGRVAGHKIGCTTKVMQRFLNIDSPCAGGVYANTIHRNSARLRHEEYLHVGVECEVVVLLEADLPSGESPHTRQSVSQAVAAIAAGMEIVDDRYENYKTMDTPTLIADDFFDAGCVIDDWISDWQRLDLVSLTGRTLINGNEVGLGRSGDVMGHPFEALAWLANSLNRRGQFLRSGEFVFTGSVVETRWVSPGDRVVIAIDSLGEARAEFV